MIEVQIVKYGMLKDVITEDVFRLGDSATLSELFDAVKNTGIDEELLSIIKWVREDNFLRPEDEIQQGDIIYLLPPSSGG